MTIRPAVKKFIRRFFRITVTTVLVIFAIILLILFLIQTTPVQNFGRKKIESYLQAKLHTRVSIGNLYLRLPVSLEIKNIYLEDQQKDTLLSGGDITIDISMLKLFRHEINISAIHLSDLTVKVKRRMPDTVFNFQFIIDAFSSPKKQPEKQKDTSGGFVYSLGTIHLHNIAAAYADDASGNDIYVKLGDFSTRVKTFDPGHQAYSIPEIALSNLSGRIRQYKPILIIKKIMDTVMTHQANAQPVQLQLGSIHLKDIALDYRNDVNVLDAGLRLGSFDIISDSIDLNSMHMALKTVNLNNAYISIAQGKTAPVRRKAVKDTVAKPGTWLFDIASFTIDKSRFQYDDANKKRLAHGMDYSHLDIQNLLVHTNDLRAAPDAYRGTIRQIAFTEKSGFVLKNLSTEAVYDSNTAQLKNLVILTNHSSIKNQTLFRYRSPAQLSKTPADVNTDLLFDHAAIAVKDVLIFAPALASRVKGNENAVLHLNGKVKGQVKNISIPYLEISGIGNTELAASGSIKGLPDAKKAYYDIVLTRLSTSKNDLLRFIPHSALPASLRLPQRFVATGSFKGMTDRFNIVLHARTSNGNLDVTGMLDLKHKSYDLRADTKALDLGYLLTQDSLLGKVSLNATAKGNGFDPRKMTGEFHLNLIDARIRQYDYHSLLLDGNMNNGKGTVSSSIDDENIRYQLHAQGDFQQKYPSLKLALQLDTLNLQALHLVKDTLQLHLGLAADFSSTNPDALEGKLDLFNIAFTDRQRTLTTDSMRLLAVHTDTAQQLKFTAEMADLDIHGRYKLTELPEALKQVIMHYYDLRAEKKPVIITPQNWQLALTLRPSPVVLEFMPALKGTDSVRANIFFNSKENDLHLLVNAPKIQMNQQVIHQLNIEAATKDSALQYGISVADAGHKGFQLYQSSVSGNLAHNKLTTSIVLKDRKAAQRYRLAGSLSQVSRGVEFVFNPDSLLLNYDKWNLPQDNYIKYDSGGIIVHNLKLDHSDESLTINSQATSTRSPVDISFANFRIRTLTQFAEQDSLLMDGIINGKAEVKDLFGNPVFTSDLRIDNLTYKKDTVGNLVLKVNNEQQNAFIADISLSGRDNDVRINGTYYTGEKKMDMEVKLNQLNLASMKSFAAAQVKDMSGYLKGAIHASGNLTQPLLKGSLHFENALITPSISGEPLEMTNDNIFFDEDGFNFDSFSFSDSAGDDATLDGNVFTKDFRNFNFDLSFNADNFRLINAPKEPNRIFYGKLNLNASVDVAGDLNVPKINANLRVNKNTDFTLILPSSDPEVEDREGVVIFASLLSKLDSTNLNRYLDSLARTASLKGLDIQATVETDSSAQFTMVIDERNGDALTLRGRAELSGGIDKSGKTSLTGNYELDAGSYNLTLSLLHRKFGIQRGSMITWTGDPAKANIDITALYNVNTAPIDLVQQQLAGRAADEINKFKTRLPFQINLKMTGELLKPVISFDITLPNDILSLWPDVDTKLQQLRSDPGEMNKQVFALLLLGRFVSDNPFESAAGGTSAQSVARESASRLLSDQLNNLAGNLIKGVDLNFDLNSQEDYSTGTAQNQTQLNVGLSKNLFSDRVRVTVGSNFELEQTNPNQNASNIAGDVSVDYRLSKDGRYMLRAYRKDQYESVIEGQVVETGVSFILTFDYDEFKDLFRNRKENRKKVKKHASKHNPPVNTEGK